MLSRDSRLRTEKNACTRFFSHQPRVGFGSTARRKLGSACEQGLALAPSRTNGVVHVSRQRERKLSGDIQGRQFEDKQGSAGNALVSVSATFFEPTLSL